MSKIDENNIHHHITQIAFMDNIKLISYCKNGSIDYENYFWAIL